MKLVQNKEGFDLEPYKIEYEAFVKKQAIARDFVKFLLTLDRQFKIIAEGDLQAMDETLPTLLNGLKLIWTISRHINHEQEDFVAILRAISTEICK
jgi:dynein heavy chain